MADGKSFLKQIAPTLASFVFGPAAGVVVEMAGKALGIDEPTIDVVRDTIRKGELTGDQIMALKQAEIMAQAKEKELGIRADEIAAADRASARDMQVHTQSKMPAVLTIMITLGFFGVLIAMFRFPEIKESAPLMIMLGSLGTAWTGACAFWFGTTSNSQTKTTLLAQAAPIK